MENSTIIVNIICSVGTYGAGILLGYQWAKGKYKQD